MTFAAVRNRRRHGCRLIALGLLLGTLAGCRAAPDLAGIATGGAAGALTANPFIGFAVGVAVRAGTEATLEFAARRRKGAEHAAIAAAAAPLEPGASTTWAIAHDIPFGDRVGEVQVTRLIETPLVTCKEIAFTSRPQDEPEKRAHPYTAAICPQRQGWGWATAEPATQRWGALQGRN